MVETYGERHHARRPVIVIYLNIWYLHMAFVEPWQMELDGIVSPLQGVRSPGSETLLLMICCC
jgi:hypothetical protein